MQQKEGEEEEEEEEESEHLLFFFILRLLIRGLLCRKGQGRRRWKKEKKIKQREKTNDEARCL